MYTVIENTSPCQNVRTYSPYMQIKRFWLDDGMKCLQGVDNDQWAKQIIYIFNPQAKESKDCSKDLRLSTWALLQQVIYREAFIRKSVVARHITEVSWVWSLRHEYKIITVSEICDGMHDCMFGIPSALYSTAALISVLICVGVWLNNNACEWKFN